MLNLIYKNDNINPNLYYLGISRQILNNSIKNENLELRKLKLVITEFYCLSNLDLYLSFDGKIKQILEIFIKNNKLVNKVIENKNRYYNNDIKKNLLKKKIKSIFLKSDVNLKDFFNKNFFEIFIININKKIDSIDFTRFYYNRLFNYFKIDHNINKYFDQINLQVFKFVKIKKILYSIQIFDKMIKLITKIVLINSKFFFLNNIKYNYTLLKFCDKTMKLVNSILLFCLLCDINIPYYCFHSDLSIAGNCRMCLVQLDTSLKPIASCAVSIGINSTIFTNTKIIQKAREGVLEFLLINHPLDCPICDQGGECDLQEQFITYGNDRGRFSKKMI
jgi:hypothetical protein